MACKGCGNKDIADPYYCKKCLIEKKKYNWCVITEVPDEDDLDGGNKCDSSLHVTHSQLKKYTRKEKTTIKDAIKHFNLERCPKPHQEHYYAHFQPTVFDLGEMFPVSPDFEREMTGCGRAPRKWYVEYEIFPASKLKEAMLRSLEVQSEYIKKLEEKAKEK